MAGKRVVIKGADLLPYIVGVIAGWIAYILQSDA